MVDSRSSPSEDSGYVHQLFQSWHTFSYDQSHKKTCRIGLNFWSLYYLIVNELPSFNNGSKTFAAAGSPQKIEWKVCLMEGSWRGYNIGGMQAASLPIIFSLSTVVFPQSEETDHAIGTVAIWKHL